MPASKLVAAGLLGSLMSAIYAAWTVNRIRGAMIAAASKRGKIVCFSANTDANIGQ
jgi:hypothetical protein